MAPYIIVLIVTVSYVVLYQNGLNRNTLLIPVLLLTTFAAVRHYTIGTDTPNYTYPFRTHLDPSKFLYDFRIEIGYQFLIKTMLRIANNYFWYLLTVAFLAITPVLIFFKKNSSNYPLSIYIYITFGFYTAIFNPIRQSIAIAICVFGINFILQKKPLHYTVSILIASLFHISAWVMLPFYMVCHSKKKLEFKIIASLSLSFLLVPLTIAYMAVQNDRYTNYTQLVHNSANGLWTVILYTLIAFGVYISGFSLRKDNYIFKTLEPITLCGISALIPIFMLGTDPSGPQRISGYFTILITILFPLILKKYSNPLFYFLFLLFSLIYFTVSVYYLGGIYPYKLNTIFVAF